MLRSEAVTHAECAGEALLVELPDGLEHLEGLYNLYGGQTGSRIARKHVKVYLQNFGYSEGVVSAFNSFTDAQAQLDYLQTLETGGAGRAAA